MLLFWVLLMYFFMMKLHRKLAAVFEYVNAKVEWFTLQFYRFKTNAKENKKWVFLKFWQNLKYFETDTIILWKIKSLQKTTLMGHVLVSRVHWNNISQLLSQSATKKSEGKRLFWNFLWSRKLFYTKFILEKLNFIGNDFEK